MNGPKQPLVWPASASDPNVSTQLTVDDFAQFGGGAALQQYLVARMKAVAPVDAGAPREWSGFAVAHLRDLVGDRVDGVMGVSAAAMQMLVAYVDYMEGVVFPGEQA